MAWLTETGVGSAQDLYIDEQTRAQASEPPQEPAAETAQGEESTCCSWLGMWCPWGDCDQAAAKAWAADVAEAEGSAQVVVEKGADGEFYVTSEIAPDGSITDLDPIKLTDTTTPATEKTPDPPPPPTPSSSPVAPPSLYSAPTPRTSAPWLWPAVIGGAAALLLGGALIYRRTP